VRYSTTGSNGSGRTRSRDTAARARAANASCAGHNGKPHHTGRDCTASCEARGVQFQLHLGLQIIAADAPRRRGGAIGTPRRRAARPAGRGLHGRLTKDKSSPSATPRGAPFDRPDRRPLLTRLRSHASTSSVPRHLRDGPARRDGHAVGDGHRPHPPDDLGEREALLRLRVHILRAVRLGMNGELLQAAAGAWGEILAREAPATARTSHRRADRQPGRPRRLRARRGLPQDDAAHQETATWRAPSSSRPGAAQDTACG